jgi:hypothetical protein
LLIAICLLVCLIISLVANFRYSYEIRDLKLNANINKQCDTSVVTTAKLNAMIQKTSEYGFFEGQRSALNNDIRIAKGTNGYWKWVKSPNRDGKEASFDLKLVGKDK